MKPFLKWPGNKYAIRELILPHVTGKRRYFEPFLGSGAIFASVMGQFKSYFLADTNWSLISTYRHIRDNPTALLALILNDWCNAHDFYYQKRNTFNHINKRFGVTTEFEECQMAALLIYLNRHCFNGLWRVNSQGEFNVPFGQYKNPALPKKEILEWSKILKNEPVALLTSDFEETIEDAQGGDVVYCDPPYIPVSKTSMFSAYTNGWKPEEDTRRLAFACRQAANRGAKVVVSNSDTKMARDLFGEVGGIAHEILVKRNIAANADARGFVSELIFTFN